MPSQRTFAKPPTLVIGSPSIAPGQPSIGELLRATFPAAGLYAFEFGPDGLAPDLVSSSSVFVYWSSATVTIDVWVLHS